MNADCFVPSFTHWNYRVVSSEDGYSIHEVYYKADGSIEAYTLNPVNSYGETAEELKADLEMMLAAFNKPVLTKAGLEGLFTKMNNMPGNY